MDSECSTTACTSSSLSDEGTSVTATPLSNELANTEQGEKHKLMCYTGTHLILPIHVECIVFLFVSIDNVDASLLSDLSADLLGLEAESWSLVVTPGFCKQHDRRTVKQQDVIYGMLSQYIIYEHCLLDLSEHLLVEYHCPCRFTSASKHE